MADLTNDESQWIKAAASAFLAIRVATQSPPDADQSRDINFLADALHNIGMAGTGNPMFAGLHTPDDLTEVERVSRRLLHSVHRAPQRKLSLLEGLLRSKV